MQIKRGDIFYANLDPTEGCEQGGVRPVLIVQNDTGNTYSPLTIVAAITSQISKPKLPTHVTINYPDMRESVVLCEQVRTLDKARLREKVGRLDAGVMERVDAALRRSLGIA